MCLRYSPTIVACVCIHLACKWSNYKIPMSAQNREWFTYVDPTATLELLEQLTEEFLKIFDQCPSRLKKKIMASTQAVSSHLWVGQPYRVVIPRPLKIWLVFLPDFVEAIRLRDWPNGRTFYPC